MTLVQHDLREILLLTYLLTHRTSYDAGTFLAPAGRVCVRVRAVAAAVGESSVERHSAIRAGAVTGADSFRQQQRLLYSAVLSSDLLPLRPSLPHYHRTHCSTA